MDVIYIHISSFACRKRACNAALKYVFSGRKVCPEPVCRWLKIVTRTFCAGIFLHGNFSARSPRILLRYLIIIFLPQRNLINNSNNNYCKMCHCLLKNFLSYADEQHFKTFNNDINYSKIYNSSYNCNCVKVSRTKAKFHATKRYLIANKGDWFIFALVYRGQKFYAAY